MYKCYPEDLTIRPSLNGRHVKPDIEWLIADIIKHGQMEPVLVWNDGGKAVLSAGFSRWRAISEINKRKLTPVKMQIKCVYIKCNEQGAFIRNISENRMRNETTPIDDAHNIQQLFDWTLDEAQVAEIYFPTAKTEDELKSAIKWLRSRVELIKLTPEAEKAMKDGRLNESAANAIAKLSSAQQKEALKGNGAVTAKDVKALLPKSNRGRKPAPVTIDIELKRRVTALFESYDAYMQPPSPEAFAYVGQAEFNALRDYVNNA